MNRHPPAVNLRVGSKIVALRSDDERIGRLLREVFADIAADDDRFEADIVFGVDLSGPSTVALYENDDRLHDDQRLGTTLRTVASKLNVLAAHHSLTPVSLHASGFVIDGEAVICAAPSGTGKTTLATELIRRGATYLSDELIGVTSDGSLRGFPKPLNIKAGQLERDPSLCAAVYRDWRRAEHVDPDDNLPLVPARRLNPDARTAQFAEPATTLVLARRDDTDPRIEPVEPAEMVAELAGNVFGFGDVPADALFALGALVARSGVGRLVYSDSTEAADLLVDRTVRPQPPDERLDIRRLEPARPAAGQVAGIGIGSDTIVFYVPTTRAIHIAPRLAEAVWLTAHEPSVCDDADIVGYLEELDIPASRSGSILQSLRDVEILPNKDNTP